jgi:hypothetical protein
MASASLLATRCRPESVVAAFASRLADADAAFIATTEMPMPTLQRSRRSPTSPLFSPPPPAAAATPPAAPPLPAAIFDFRAAMFSPIFAFCRRRHADAATDAQI